MGDIGFPFRGTAIRQFSFNTRVDLRFAAACTRNDPPRSIQAEGSNTFGPLTATVTKRFEPFTSAAVLLVQRHSDSEKTILKLADRRLGYRGGRLPSKDICNTPYVKPRRAWRPTGSSFYAMTRTGLTPRFGRIGCGRSPLRVTSCRATTLNSL